MFSFFRHIKALGCAMFASLVMMSCDSTASMPQEPEESAGLFLVCNVGMVGETRAGQTPYNEGMHTLRLVVMDIDRSEVEYNRVVSFDNVCENYSFVAEIKEGAYKPGGSHKRIFLISNEESVTNLQSDNSVLSLPGSLHSMLESVQVGDKNFESKINSVYYVPDFTKNIPLTAVYDITIPDGIRYVEESFWLVRVATKFSVVFENANIGIGVTVSSAKITGLSDRHFLMPRFTNGVAPTFAGYDTWIDWLKDVSDLSQNDPYNPTADASGWLYGYEIPSTAAAVELSCISSPFTLAAATATNTPSRTVSNLYAAESRNRIAGSPIGEQRYTFVMNATSGSITKTFTTAIPNVRALFRNTHVKLSVIFSEDFNITPKVDVVPFSAVLLNPGFGLERDNISGYIVVRDPETDEILYWLDRSGNKWYIYEDGDSHYVFAFDDVDYSNLDHWFDYTGVKHALTPAGISGFSAYYDTTFEDKILYWVDDEGHKYWLTINEFFSVTAYSYNEHGDNPSGTPLFWFDFMGRRHDMSVKEDDVIQKWKDILTGNI